MFFKKKPQVIIHPITACREPVEVYYYEYFQLILNTDYGSTNPPKELIVELERTHELYPKFYSFDEEVMDNLWYVCPILKSLVDMYSNQCPVCIETDNDCMDQQWVIYPMFDINTENMYMRYDNNHVDLEALMYLTSEFFLSKGWSCIRG